MRLSILIYDGFTALDVVGGYESLSRIPGMEVEFVAKQPGLYAADTRRLGLLAWRNLVQARGADILYVPGGPGAGAAQRDPQILDFLREAHAGSTWTVGICSGVEMLATAGVLQDVEVTTNINCRERVAALGARVVPVRYHRDGKVVTGAGVSASMEAGLFLTRLIVGDDTAEVIQLGVEYYPDPPFGPKTPDEASDRAKAIMKAYDKGSGAVIAGLDPPFDAVRPGRVMLQVENA